MEKRGNEEAPEEEVVAVVDGLVGSDLVEWTIAVEPGREAFFFVCFVHFY